MTLYELISTAINLQNEIDTSWALFFSVNSAILGGLVFVDKKFSVAVKGMAISIYAGLMFLLYEMTRQGEKALEAVISDMSLLSINADEAGTHLFKQFTDISEQHFLYEQDVMTLIIYIGAFILVSGAVVVEGSEDQL